MEVSVENTGSLERRMTVQVPAERVDQEVDTRLQSMSTTVRLDGFRPGKVPMKVVRKRFGVQARQEAYGDLIQSSFYEAAVKEKLNPAGEPSIQVKDEDGQFSYTAEFEVVPSVELADMSDVAVERPVSELTDADVEGMIEKLRSQRITWNKVERAAQNGDQVMIKFAGTIDGEAFDGGSADNVPLVLGSGAMIEGFEAGILGAEVGDERSVDVTFPDDYQAAHLAGKGASFAITLNEVSEPVLPEIDEEFAKVFGVADGSVEQFRQDIRNNMQREMDQKLKNMTKEKVMDALIEKHEIQVPQSMIDREAQSLLEDTRQRMEQQGQGQAGNFELPLDIFKEQAERRVKLGMLVAEVVDKNGLKVNDELVRSTIEELAGSYETPQEVVDWYFADETRLAPVRNVVLEEQVVEWVLGQVNVEEKQLSFDELV